MKRLGKATLWQTRRQTYNDVRNVDFASRPGSVLVGQEFVVDEFEREGVRLGGINRDFDFHRRHEHPESEFESESESELGLMGLPTESE